MEFYRLKAPPLVINNHTWVECDGKLMNIRKCSEKFITRSLLYIIFKTEATYWGRPGLLNLCKAS